jgi:hypothetical protein
LRLIQNSKEASSEALIKGKKPLLDEGTTNPRKPKETKNIPWCKPPSGWVKLCIDGSFCSGSTGNGTVLRDVDGLPIFIACRALVDCEEALEAELRACVEGLELTLQHNNLLIIIESDCSQLIAAVKFKGHDRSSLLYLISHIKFLASQ